MPSTYKLAVTSSSVNPITGHHTIICHIEETTDKGGTIAGVPETWGIESRGLQLRFGGDIVAWRGDVSRRMLKVHRDRSAAVREVVTWHGKKFDIPGPP